MEMNSFPMVRKFSGRRCSPPVCLSESRIIQHGQRLRSAALAWK